MEIKMNLEMRKLQFVIRIAKLGALFAFGFRPVDGQFISDIGGTAASTNFFQSDKLFGNGFNKTPMHKAILTQRGYIQFLRWELPVPDIEEFTFCLWVKSDNLTYSHSIFSYSMNEKARLVSSWISPYGRSVNLEIGGVETIAHRTQLKENHWYHICQSWENRLGHYGLWINGRKEVEGYSTRLVGHVIPRGGDIVVGQEYTDFDKGLEEGIEGAVIGFNLLLVSAFDGGNYPQTHRPVDGNRNDNFRSISLPDHRIPVEFGTGRIPSSQSDLNSFVRSDRDGLRIAPYPREEVRFVRKSADGSRVVYPRRIVNGRREGTFDSTLKEYLGGEELFGRNFHGRNEGERRGVVALKIVHKNKRDLSSMQEADEDEGKRRIERSRRTARNLERRLRRRIGRVPLGLELIDSSYSRCEIGRGSPLIGGTKMLISWTRTPVRVFGGAILKNVRSICGHFPTV